jgi:ABC-type Fe3+-siderophore transport system permease subunit
VSTIAVVAVEIGMLLGIVAAAFTVPRSTPLLTFGIISGAAFVLGNVLLIRRRRNQQPGDGQGLSPQRKRNLTLIIVLFAVYWMICFLLRKH